MIIKWKDILKSFNDVDNKDKDKNYWLHGAIMNSDIDPKVMGNAMEKGEYNIELLIDGVPHDPSLINNIIENLDKHIDEEAKKLAREIFNEAMQKGNILNEIIDEASNKICDEFNIDYIEFDY